MTTVQQAEMSFRVALAEALQAGVTHGRLAGLVIEAWRRDEPATAQMLGPRYASAEGRDAQADTGRRLWDLVFKSVRITTLTDTELADVLDGQIHPKLNALDLESSIVSNLIERLRRADGGPCPTPDDDDG